MILSLWRNYIESRISCSACKIHKLVRRRRRRQLLSLQNLSTMMTRTRRPPSNVLDDDLREHEKSHRSQSPLHHCVPQALLMLLWRICYGRLALNLLPQWSSHLRLLYLYFLDQTCLDQEAQALRCGLSCHRGPSQCPCENGLYLNGRLEPFPGCLRCDGGHGLQVSLVFQALSQHILPHLRTVNLRGSVR